MEEAGAVVEAETEVEDFEEEVVEEVVVEEASSSGIMVHQRQ